jgi:hypothetical protein
MLGGHIPSLHDMQHAEHLAGVYAALWPAHRLQSDAYILLGQSGTGSGYWSDYTPWAWPGLGGYAWYNTAVMNTRVAGKVEQRRNNNPTAFACAGELVGARVHAMLFKIIAVVMAVTNSNAAAAVGFIAALPLVGG